MSVYTIKKGKHYCDDIINRAHLHFGITDLEYIVKINNDCWWGPARNNDDYGINKVCGLSYGLHHTNSVRFGWIPKFHVPHIISLYGYWYSDKIRQFQFLTNVETNTYNLLGINTGKDQTILKVNDKQFTIDFKLPTFKFGYFLYPYCGGNNVAPSNMTMEINVVKKT